MGIIPDRIILFADNKIDITTRLGDKLLQLNPKMTPEEIEESAAKIILEYELNLGKVKDVYRDFIF